MKKYKLWTCTNVCVKPVQNGKSSFCILVSDKNTHDLATYIYTSLDMVVQSAHHPVLILVAAKETCHLPRNICDYITTVAKTFCMIHNKF